ncbi:MAG: hypothetical protein NVSMB14_07620 [Isosphaeraceae bacterium]
MSEGATKLQYALKNLRIAWDATEPYWRDAVRADFEKLHLSPLETTTKNASRGMAKIGEILSQARRDCS